MKKYILIGLVFIGIVSAAGVAYAAIYTGSPNSCSTTSWINCSDAFSSNDVYTGGATGALGIWTNYSLGLPSSFTVTKVEIGVEDYKRVSGQACLASTVSVEASIDGGGSFGQLHSVNLAGCDGVITWVDITSDFASSSWTPIALSSSSFQVRMGCTSTASCLVDWVPVRVTTQ